MLIRKTKIEDIDSAAEIYESAKGYMRKSGNLKQWSTGRPNAESIREDISEGCSYVCERDGEIIAVFYFKKGVDPTYVHIYDGAWRSSGEYAVIHRIAVKYHGEGIADFIYRYCFNRCSALRIDTHKDNLPMQKSLLKNGFEYCGIIYISDGSERLAYEKV